MINFACSYCVVNGHLEDGLCICDTGYSESHSEGKCESGHFNFKFYIYRVIIT